MSYKVKVKKPPKTDMCPIGFHIVRGHYRICKSGTSTWVDVHMRKNRGRKTMYLSENFLHIYWKNTKNYPKLKAVKGYLGNHEIDPVIQFWLEYWGSRFQQFPKMDPLLIKAIIAKESSFNSKAYPKVSHSSAYGLMQIVDKARKSMTGTVKSSVTRDYITVSKKELGDPVVNIAVGIRWLIVKYFNVQRKKGNSVHNTIKAYYGSKKKVENEEYLKRVLDLYNSSRK